MYPNEITLINQYLKKNHLDYLICDKLYLKSYQTVLKILQLEE